MRPLPEVCVVITTKTSDLLMSMAHRLNAISSAIYEAGYRDEAREVQVAAHRAAIAAASIEEKLDSGARAMLRDDPDLSPAPFAAGGAL